MSFKAQLLKLPGPASDSHTTPPDPTRVCGVVGFRISGLSSTEAEPDNGAAMNSWALDAK